MSPDSQAPEEELFVLPADADRYYVYAPLRRSGALVNAAVVRVLAAFLQSGAGGLQEQEQEIIEQLQEAGLLGRDPPTLPLPPTDYLFLPYETTLFPTERCNLRCVYCYANSGQGGDELSWEAARGAIDLIVENAGLSGRENIVLGFHGGGEPFLRWNFVIRCAEYVHEKASASGLQAQVHAATNGVLSFSQRETIASRFTGVNISFDGPEEIHNHNRPLANGGGSFQAVMDTISHFEELGFPYGIRTTITSQSVSRLGEIVDFIRETCPSLDQLHVEPLWYCGRCHTSGEHPPDAEVFVQQFLEAWEKNRHKGLTLFYSGARLDTLTNRFCAAPGEGFSITPRGLVTSCFEVVSPEDPRSQVFHYGYYDAGEGRYVFDEDRLQQLRKLTVDHLSFCQDCFCKWHCAGDCLAKALQYKDSLHHQGSSRCQVNRAITQAELIMLAKGGQNLGLENGGHHAQETQ